MHLCIITEDRRIWIISKKTLIHCCEEMGENCSHITWNLSMSSLSAIGVSTYATAEVLMCLLALCTSVSPSKSALTIKHMIKHFV